MVTRRLTGAPRRAIDAAMRANYKLKRLFVDVPLDAGLDVSLAKASANYLINVLRGKPGDELLLFNGCDGEWRARLDETDKRAVVLSIQNQERPQPPASDLVYAFAPLKAARLDYMVQKAVEMGAGVLQPVMTQHTQVNRLNVDRMLSNAIEAAQQCGVLSIPECRSPVRLDALLSDWNPDRALVFCDEDHADDNPLALLQTLKGRPLGLLVGPEGGFSDSEREQLRALAFVTAIPLGPRVLRADTAAVAALALLQAAAGDWTR